MPAWLSFLQPILDVLKPLLGIVQTILGWFKKSPEEKSEKEQTSRNDQLDKDIEYAKNRGKPN